ncbi:curli-like amyloid fiber formation chaperone CsgH [Salinimicrobium terrae]|uniref:curli-like amyloid fiber formation chaperone CsgH n=1 Tax=Salinimicrobium terrae TaxID=470866 RepID=UPI000414B7AF|nr:curli-like amyloid fiber formation chaperone CsgH [Salinimicrobium terrae]
MNLNSSNITNLKHWLFLPVFLFYSIVIGQNFNAEVEAVLKIDDTKDDLLEVTGVATNKTEGNFSLRYELAVITSDENKNSSRNSQEGRFTLGSNETKELSTTSVSVNPTQQTIILLLLYDLDEKVIGTARQVYNEKNEEQQSSENTASYQKENEGIELTGFVTENTKTKPGRDFYDFFYQQYSLSASKSNKMIHVDETISFGRTTRIIVKVEDRVVYQFFARPRLDFLKEQANEALRQVNRYLEYLENRNEYNTKY